MTRKEPMHLLLLILATWVMAACGVRGAEPDAATRLRKANELNSDTRELISTILLDITNRGNRFDAESRREALDAIGRLHADAFMSSVRNIAAMDLDKSGRRRHNEVVAIASALAVLADLGDRSAARLNKERLHDESFRGFAIQNLSVLHAWDATAAVESELLSMRLSNANGNEVAAMLEFLIASPQSGKKACAVVDRVTSAYPECARSDETSAASFCVDLLQRSIELRTAKCGARTELRLLHTRSQVAL
jgi:hypothetical protein